MSLRKYLLIPQLSLYTLRAPRDQGQAWQRYWSSVEQTGADGDVLWDADQPAEIEAVAAQFRAHADLSLPLVDLGCGNGRQARALAPLFPRVVGLDASAAAIERARAETANPEIERAQRRIEFRVADLAEPGWSQEVASDLGEVNVHVRGVLHVIDPDRRAAVVMNLATVLGTRGTAYVCETDLAGDPLDYLLFQGVTPTSMPAVVRRLIAAGVRAPSHFGPDQVAQFFPGPSWQVLAQGPSVMHGVPLQPGGPVQQIPSYEAVLRFTPVVGPG